MRIKLRCPHCGDWFTLTLGIENGEAEARDAGGQPEEADADEEPGPSASRPSRARLIAASCIVAAAVIVIWAAVALRQSDEGRAVPPDEIASKPAPTSQVDPGELGSVGSVESDETGEDAASAPSAEPSGVEEPQDRDEDAHGVAGRGVSSNEASGAQAGGATVPAPDQRAPAAAASGDHSEGGAAAAPGREVLELTAEALERCWIRVEADGVIVADETLDQGERRRWRADGFFDIDVGKGDAVRLYLNGRDLGRAGRDARVVEGLRVTRDGIRGR
jgi:cytoskeletal protein RodZ